MFDHIFTAEMDLLVKDSELFFFALGGLEARRVSNWYLLGALSIREAGAYRKIIAEL